MVIKKKSTKAMDKFIDKGAEVKAKTDMGFRSVLIRIPSILLNQLDEDVKNKPWMTRTQWIMEAIYDRLQEE